MQDLLRGSHVGAVTLNGLETPKGALSFEIPLAGPLSQAVSEYDAIGQILVHGTDQGSSA